MNGVLEKLDLYFQYPFVQYALIVGILIALCSSLLGVTLVLKRFSFIGDGLSHVAFGAIAVSSILNISNDMLFVLPATIICAILLLRTGQNTRIKGDAAIAMISVGALAVGYLLMNIFPPVPTCQGMYAAHCLALPPSLLCLWVRYGCALSFPLRWCSCLYFSITRFLRSPLMKTLQRQPG